MIFLTLTPTYRLKSVNKNDVSKFTSLHRVGPTIGGPQTVTNRHENQKTALNCPHNRKPLKFGKPHLTLKSNYINSLLCEISQKVKAYNYDTTIIKNYLVAYPDSTIIVP